MFLYSEKKGFYRKCAKTKKKKTFSCPITSASSQKNKKCKIRAILYRARFNMHFPQVVNMPCLSTGRVHVFADEETPLTTTPDSNLYTSWASYAHEPLPWTFWSFPRTAVFENLNIALSCVRALFSSNTDVQWASGMALTLKECQSSSEFSPHPVSHGCERLVQLRTAGMPQEYVENITRMILFSEIYPFRKVTLQPQTVLVRRTWEQHSCKQLNGKTEETVFPPSSLTSRKGKGALISFFNTHLFYITTHLNVSVRNIHFSWWTK